MGAIIAVDVGGTNTRFAVVDDNLSIVERHMYRTDPNDPKTFFKELKQFITKSKQQSDGNCPDCGRPTVKLKEEGYFLRLSKYQDRLLSFIKENPDFIQPETRKNEVVSFIESGLEDLSVSRTSFDWGIHVNSNPKHVVYVWIDALSNYLTALGYKTDEDANYQKYWVDGDEVVHVVGKDILRFHAIYWPIMLMALNVPIKFKLYAHGWWLMKDGKMTKSKGDVVYPQELVDRYGLDAMRLFLVKEMPLGNDSVFTYERFIEKFNVDLANDLGNLLSRTISMIEKYNDCIIPSPKTSGGFHEELKSIAESMPAKVDSAMDRLQFNEALEEVWKLIRRSNKYVDETMPWALAKDESKKDELDTVLYNLAESLRIATVMISPILHITADKIFNQLGVSEDIKAYESSKEFGLIKEGTKINKGEILFPRLDIDKELGVMEEMFGKKKEEVNELPKEEVKEEIKEEKKGKEEITIDDFAKVELKVGKVLEAEKHPKADKLLVFKIKLKDEVRQIVSGIAKFYDPAELIGRNVVVVTNLKPVKLRGIESQGMILSAATEDDSKLVLISAQDIEDGVEVR